MIQQVTMSVRAKRVLVIAPMLVTLVLSPRILLGQNKVLVVRHGSTPEGDLLRARADAVLALRQAELVGEKALTQRLENMIKECDVAYKRFATRQEVQKEALESKYGRAIDLIRFNQELADIRAELQRNGIMQRTRNGDPTRDMNRILEQLAHQPVEAKSFPSLTTELSPEQLDSVYLTDGSSIFSARTGKTMLETFRWPFYLQQQDFGQEREAFELLCDQAIQEMGAKGAPSPDTIMSLLKSLDTIGTKINSIVLSDSPDIHAVETKWRMEAKGFVQELSRALGNTSRLESSRLTTYVFDGRTLGDLIVHMNKHGLRFSKPDGRDVNLYASVFFLMRYALQESGKQPQGDAEKKTTEPLAKASGVPSELEGDSGKESEGNDIDAALSKPVTLVAPYPVAYPDAPTDKMSLQYAVIELAKQAALSYDWEQSANNANDKRRKWVYPDIRGVPFNKALDALLKPEGLTWMVQEGKVVLVKAK